MSDFYAPNPNKDYLLVSVQYTGTRFTQRILADAKIQTAQIHPVKTRSKQLDGWLEQNQMADLPIIVPIRNPLNVAESWISRAKQHSKDEAAMRIPAMFAQWAYLAEIIAVSKPLFLPVDHPEKELYLDEMADVLGVKLWTDWKKYGHKPGAEKIALTNQQITELNELIGTTFLADFYAEIPHGT